MDKAPIGLKIRDSWSSENNTKVSAKLNGDFRGATRQALPVRN